MNVYWILARQVWQARRNLGQVWMIWSLVALTIPAVLVIYFLGLPLPVALADGIGGPYFLLLMACWVFFIQNLIMQNNPVNSHLVPVLRKRLIRLALAVWLLSSLPAAGLFSLAWGHFLHWWLIFALLLLSLTNLFSSPWSVGVYVLLAWFNQHAQVLARRFWDLPADSGALWLGLVGILVAGYLSFLFLLKNGGDRHWRHHTKFQRWQIESMHAGKRDVPWTGMPQLWQRVLGLAYFARLARQLRTHLSPAQQIAVGLGPSWYWGTTCLPLLSVALSVLLAGYAAQMVLHNTEAMALVGSVLPAWIGIMPISFIGHHMQAPYQTCNEQAVMCLTPGLPGGQALNRALAAQTLRFFALVWGLALLAGAVVSLAVQVPLFWQMLAVQLLLPVYLLRDYARSAAPMPTFIVLPIMQTVAGVLLWRGLQACVQAPVWILFAGCAVAGALLVAWRWRRVCAAPVAFPAGYRGA